MKNFLDKLGKTASEAASKAGDKASELIEIGKLKSKISSKKQDISLAKKEIGDYCYSLFESETINEIDNERIIEICEKIKAYTEEIQDLQEQIESVKDE